jgi:prepilin-type N-terminal cleavage/methylation domain-containing protein
MSTTNRDGFTLIELLIVVVIIGILAAIAIPKFSATRERAFVSAMSADLRNLASLQEVHHNANYTYSTDQDALGFTRSEGVTVTIAEATGGGWSATAVHAGLPGESCALYHGNAAQVSPATTESMIQCSY